MDKYEISLWEDFPDTTNNGIPFLNERKLCVIGTDTMTSQVRAVEPKMITNINGTHTFSFKMYYTYVDELTGEAFANPFGSLLINERKVKVFWKDQWYDLIIKSLEEDTANKSITYICKDSFITELSKNGYNLTFTTDLQNNIGTASDLADQVLLNSGWQFDNVHSTKIIQKTEEAVYETTVNNEFEAIKQSPDGDTTIIIEKNRQLLIFYSSIIEITSTTRQDFEIQFLYTTGDFITEENSMLVLTGDCCKITVSAYKSGGNVYAYIGNTRVFYFSTDSGISTRYRGKRLVETQLTKYDTLLNKYVNVYTDVNNRNEEVWGYSKTEFSDPLTIINLIVNSSNFTGTEGWIGNDLTYGVYPTFKRNTNLSTYTAKSYLKLSQGRIYNYAFSSNKAYFTPSQGDIRRGDINGLHIGEKYIFRVKVKTDGEDPSSTAYIYDDIITPLISEYIDDGNSGYSPTGTSYFSVGERVENDTWNEYELTCIQSCAADNIDTLGLFLQVNTDCWVEDIEFFKYAVGITSYESTVEHRMNPGEMSLQGISKVIYRYYNSDHNDAASAEELTFLYEGETPLEERFIPKTNNYEKIATIEAKASNRFNILQSIAESFECWVRFTINHDLTGRVTYDEDGLPEKYVTLVDSIGEDLGWSFEYSIDLKNIRRKVVSENIVTKIIVLPNENEFGTNGFCSIARSNLNYTKENFILNLDYYIEQGLLDQRTVERDLYSSSNNYIGYYYYLHNYNKEYDEITNIITRKKTELTKQKSQLIVLEEQDKATKERLASCKSDLMTLACVTDWASAQSYAQSHIDHTKVQTLMNTIAQLQNTIDKNRLQIQNLSSSIDILETYLLERVERQKQIIVITEDLHTRFFKKYVRYLQEGTWQDNGYIDDNKYYLDAVDVAYTSSRPQLQYEINVMRLSALEDFSSKVFNVGDICYIQDREYFGYNNDGITPYKLKIIISEITSFFDSPEKDIIKVQNYKTQFDDLFQRITATTQSLQYSQGGFEKATSVINHDKTLNFDMLQNTFDENEGWVLNASNQQVIWDSTGITVTDDKDIGLQLRIIAGGIFISNDGGVTWKNAVRGDGISTDVLTAGRINTSEIYVYDGNHPSFRWDSSGIDAYYYNDILDAPAFNKYVRFDRFGIYGYQGSEDFVPSTEDAIWEDNSEVKFGLTWRGFFLRGSNGNSELEISDDGNGIVFLMKNAISNNSLEISTEKDIILKTGNINRVQIGRLDPTNNNTEYGIWIRDGSGNNIFNVSSAGTNSIGGWNLTSSSFYSTSGANTIGLYSNGQSATIQGQSGSFYILAGSNFGVTVDGSIYSSSGKIGGWTINSDSLSSGNIVLNSGGNISVTNGWSINSDGSATFSNITATGGYIGGWHITSDSITNDNGTTLGVGGTYNVNKYTIKTNSLSASSGEVGGWTMSPSGFTGTNIGLYNDGRITLGNVTLDGTSQTGYLASSGGIYANGNINITNGNLIISTTDKGITFSNSTTFNAADAVGTKNAAYDLGSYYDSSKNYSYSDSRTRKGYLDWLHTNWGTTTPNTVRVAGIDSTWINSWTAYKGTAFEQNGTWYLPVSGKAYIYGTDINGNNHAATSNPSGSSAADNLDTKNLIVTDIYTAGRNSKKTGTISTITSDGTYYASTYNLDGFSSVSISISQRTVSSINGPYEYSYNSNGYVNGVKVKAFLSDGTETNYVWITWSYS